MHLIQILLPVRDNAGNSFEPSCFETVRQELTERCGGVTAYTRSPAQGTFEAESGQVMHDDIVVFEAMCDTLDRAQWAAYRKELMQRFTQEDVIVRALPCERL